MNRPQHISELLPDFCKSIGMECPPEILKRAEEEKKKNDEFWNKSLTAQQNAPKVSHDYD